jgi:hypothetical protein
VREKEREREGERERGRERERERDLGDEGAKVFAVSLGGRHQFERREVVRDVRQVARQDLQDMNHIIICRL